MKLGKLICILFGLYGFFGHAMRHSNEEMIAMMEYADRELEIDGHCYNRDIASDVQNLAGLTGLTKLSLWCCKLNPAILKAISCLTNLRELVMRDERSNYGDSSISQIRNFPTTLRRLSLNGHHFPPPSTQVLAPLTNLERLSLRGSFIGDDGIQSLAGLYNLIEPDLFKNDLGDDATQAFTCLTNLKVLVLKDNHISTYAIQNIRKCLPNCDIIF
jgi:Leucine Rich Repeat (LRR) protein